MHALAFVALLGAGAALAQPVPRPDTEKVEGTVVPDIELTGDDGERFRLSDLSGMPLVISPIFTRCPYACQAITSSLRDALVAIAPPGERYEVVTLSFDPDDTVEDLAAYRERHALPPGWRLAVAAPGDVAAVLEALDFETRAAPTGGFEHPNAVAVLTPQRAVSSFVFGIAYETDDFRKALHSAVSGPPLLDRAKGWIVLVALLGAAATLATIVLTGRKKPRPA